MPPRTDPSMPRALSMARLTRPKRAIQPVSTEPAATEWPGCQPKPGPSTGSTGAASRSTPPAAATAAMWCLTW